MNALHRHWSRRSLAARLMAGAALALLVTVGLLFYDWVQDETQHIEAALATLVDDQVESLAPHVAERAAAGDHEAIEQMLKARIRRRDIAEVAWTDSAGRRIAVANPESSPNAPVWLRAWFPFPIKERTEPLLFGGTGYGRISVRSTPTPMLDNLWEAAQNKFCITLLGLFLFVGFTGGILAGALNPLMRLAGAARRFGRGDTEVRIAPSGPPEVRDCLKAFNSMADNIGELLASLRESESRNRLLVAAVEQSGDAILTDNLDGIITSWNPGAERLYGFRADEAIGRSLYEVLAGENERTLRREALAVDGPASYETRRRTRCGSLVDVEVSLAPLFENGRRVGQISISRDVTEAHRTRRVLAAEKERAQVTLESIGDGVITTDTDGNVEYLNPVAEKLTGWSTAAARGRPLAQVFQVSADCGAAAEGLFGRALRDGRSVALTTGTLLSKDGGKFAVEHSVSPIRSRESHIVGTVLVFRDVSHAREMAHQLSWQAAHDALTGLFNRREFEQRLNELVESSRLSPQSHCLLYLDLDQFKVVNDTCGHGAGDELLRQLSGILQQSLRGSDTLARLGGDEFGVLLEGCPLEQAQAIAEKLRGAIAKFRFVWQDKSFAVGASIGLVAIHQPELTATGILGAADAACYSAKDNGRNRVQVYRPDDSDLTARRGEMQWVSRINRALEEDRFVLYRQDILPLTQAEPGDHFEILVRILDEEGRIVPPMAFIPAAERYNLMPAIDRRVVGEAFSRFAELYRQDSGRILATAAINLSGATLNDAGFLDFVFEEFARTRVPPQKVCFEITETVAIANLARARQLITALKAIGCRFALDDFGSGMSSFAYLKNLPVDYVKIDGAFVRDMEHDAIDRAMVRAIHDIAHQMGLRTIAEFVENERVLAMLREIGMGYAQGYGISKPQPLAGPVSSVRLAAVG